MGNYRSNSIEIGNLVTRLLDKYITQWLFEEAESKQLSLRQERNFYFRERLFVCWRWGYFFFSAEIR